MMCCFPSTWCCFPQPSSPPPAIVDISPERENHWQVSSIKTNLAAVPFSEEPDQLKKVQEIAEKYIKVISEMKERKPDDAEALPLLKQLKILTEKRLLVAQYFKCITSMDYTLLKKIKNWNENNTSEIMDCLGNARSNLTACERNLKEEKNKIKNYKEEFRLAQECLKELEFLLNTIQSGLKEKNDLAASKQLNDQLNEEQEPIWSIKTIQALKESISEYSREDLETLIGKIRTQQTENQKKKVLLEDSLATSLNTQKVIQQTFEKITEFEKRLTEKLESISPLKNLSLEEGVELDDLKSKSSPLNQHKIKGTTHKKYVALTEEK